MYIGTQLFFKLPEITPDTMITSYNAETKKNKIHLVGIKPAFMDVGLKPVQVSGQEPLVFSLTKSRFCSAWKYSQYL